MLLQDSILDFNKILQLLEIGKANLLVGMQGLMEMWDFLLKQWLMSFSRFLGEVSWSTGCSGLQVPGPSHQHGKVATAAVMKAQFQLCDSRISVRVMCSGSSVLAGHSQRWKLPRWFSFLVSGSHSGKPRLELTSPCLPMILQAPNLMY